MTSDKVKCQSCEKLYESVGFGENQATYCASEVHNGKIVGFFGSAVIDMESWRFTQEQPEWVKNGTICDQCIIKLQNENKIKLDEQGVW